MISVLAVVCFLMVTIDSLHIQTDLNSAKAKVIKRRDDATDSLASFYGLSKNTNYERSLQMLKQLTKLSPLADKDTKNEKRFSMPGPVIDPPILSPNMPYPPGMPGSLQPDIPGVLPPRPYFDEFDYFDLQPLNVPLETFLSLMVIESSGLWDNGGVTVRASFPAVNDFKWVLSTGVSHATYTKGKYKSSTAGTNTSLTLDQTENFIIDVTLEMSLPTGRLFIRLDRQQLNVAGTLQLEQPSLILDAPNEVFVTEEGVAQFTVRAPPAGADIKPSLDAFYSYLDTSSDQPTFGSDIVFSRYSNHSQSFNSSGPQLSLENVTINVGPNAQKYGGTISVHTSYIPFFPMGGSTNNYIEFIGAAKDVTVVSYEKNLAEGVAFSKFDIGPPWEAERFPAFIRHGSIQCSAIGNPPPHLSIAKDGLTVKTYNFGGNGVYRRIFHPLDGRLAEDVVGVYTCTAYSGSSTISRPIFVSL